jgi:hypothetical protein
VATSFQEEGHIDPQGGLFTYFSVEKRIPAEHPLRRVKAQPDAVLRAMTARLDAMHAEAGPLSPPSGC